MQNRTTFSQNFSKRKYFDKRNSEFPVPRDAAASLKRQYLIILCGQHYNLKDPECSKYEPRKNKPRTR